MKLTELFIILDACIDSLNRTKHRNITRVKYELVKERPDANYCDKCKVLFSYDSPARKGKGFFGLKLDMWTFIADERHEFNYIKMVMRWMRESLKKAEERVIRIPTIQKRPTTLNLSKPIGRPSTLGSSFGRVGTIGNSIDIANEVDTCVAVIPSGAEKPVRISTKEYNKTDVMMTGKLFDIMKQEKTKGYLKAPVCKPILLK